MRVFSRRPFIPLLLAGLFGLLTVFHFTVDAAPLETRSATQDFPEELSRGVQAIASPGTPGGLTTFGSSAWPLVAGGGVPVAGAAERDGGKAGRLVAFTQGGFVEPGVVQAKDTKRFLLNAGEWASGKGKRATWANVGGGTCKLAEALGVRIADDWLEADVLIATTGNLTPARIAKVNQHLAEGGGLLVGCTPWGWQQLTPKLRMSRDLTLNRVMEPFGIVFDNRFSRDSGSDCFLVGDAPDSLLHAGIAFRELSLGALAGDRETTAKRVVHEAIKSLSDFEPEFMMPVRVFAARGASAFAKEVAGWLKGEEERRGLLPLHERWDGWQIMGPLAGGRRGKEIAGELRVEEEIATWKGEAGPDLSDRWKGAKGKVGWQKLELAKAGRTLDVGELALEELLARGLTAKQKGEGWSDRRVAFLYRRIVVEAEAGPSGVNYNMRLQADGGLRVWLDGQVVGTAIPADKVKGGGPVAMPEVRFALSLKPGVHHLVVKVAHTEPAWRFRARGGEGLDPSAVNAAIDRGVAYLISQQYLDGSWPGYAGYGVGLTALNLYALAESGLPRDHPAIRRSLAYLDAHPSEYVYSLGCEMLARAQLDRGDQVEILQREAWIMASWEEPTGLYAYPLHPNGNFLPDDVSNTLFAALALSAAHKRGVEVEQKIWLGMIEGTLQCMETEKAGVTGQPPLGFAYRPRGTVTGSMTTAGLSILLTAREALGPALKRKQATEIDHAVERGLRWMDENMTWDNDPNGGWHFFFLYGIERLGSLLGVEILGGIPWYESGAEYLIGKQGDNGKWSAQQHDVDTALALLFLNRATAPVSGQERAVEWRLLSAEGDLGLRGKIGDGLEVWLTGLASSLRESRGLPDEAELRVESIQWIGVKEGVKTILEEVRDGGGSKRFAANLHPAFDGAFELFARAQIVIEGDESAGFELDSSSMQVPALYTDAQLAYGADENRNLLRGAQASATSSQSKPADALDGDHGTNWICKADDAEPKWMAELSRSAVANRLLITHRGPRPEHQGLSRVSRVRVVVNGSITFELDLSKDLMKKTVVELGPDVRVKTVEIFLLGFTGVRNSGFSEIELVLEDG